MIASIVLDSVEARVLLRKPTSQFHTNINIRKVKTAGPRVSVSFEWLVKYGEGSARTKMVGTLLAIEPPTTISAIKKEWAKRKSLPDAFSNEAINAINYFCTVNSGFVVRPLNIVPPYNVPPLHEVK